MAKKKKAKKALVSIELGLGGLAGLTAASFCIFLWMFLFGMWTGQSVLNSADDALSAKDGAGLASKIWGKSTAVISDSKKEKPATEATTKSSDAVVSSEKEVSKDSDTSFFAVQVSAFKDQQRAIKSVLQWRARDYESFYLMPEPPNGKFHRVFVGRFDSLVEANTLAAKLESAEQRKVFITLVSADEKRLPE